MGKTKSLSVIQRAQVLNIDKNYANGKYLLKSGVVRQQCVEQLQSIKRRFLYRSKKDWKIANHHCTRRQRHKEDSHEVIHRSTSSINK